ncbi:hypothetical protein [Algoriella sp.]|uniref:hypothetical protein n=1 Tax=Algoriella sp. TaxID=1872434 RepID=UPI001B26F0A1|nr:hypothetical protein [Algoriella sp.]MBO6212364.1 hypothetical protein [Algoriella sp.]
MNKKQLIKFILVLFPIIGFSQVGIGTETPSRMLDINGDLRIRQLDDKTDNTDESYRYLLSAKDDEKNQADVVTKVNGQVDKISFPSLLQSSSNNVEVKKIIYRGDADKTKKCSCGDLTIYLDKSSVNTDILSFIHLNSTDVFVNNNAESITLKYGQKKYTGTAYTYADDGITFTKSRGTEAYNQLDTSNLNSGNTVRIYTIVLPGENNLYRFTVSRFLNNSTTYINSLICEKFYIQSID